MSFWEVLGSEIDLGRSRTGAVWRGFSETLSEASRTDFETVSELFSRSFIIESVLETGRDGKGAQRDPCLQYSTFTYF